MRTDPTDVPGSTGNGETRASVCLASYRGGRFITEQLESVLSQLGPDDELVIVDDASPDDTVEQIKSFQDGRIRLIEAAVNQGYVRSFEQAVLASKGQYILLADQDDVWVPGRLELMIDALQASRVVASNFDVLGGGPRPNIPRQTSSESSWDTGPITAVAWLSGATCCPSSPPFPASCTSPTIFGLPSAETWQAPCGTWRGQRCCAGSTTTTPRPGAGAHCQ